MQGDLERVFFDEPTILRRLDEIAAQISNDYREKELTVIAVLNGSLMFMADLLRRIPLPLKLDCLSVASYHGKAETSGEVLFKEIALPDVQNRHILILDDILDSGNTLAAIREKLQRAGSRSISRNSAPAQWMRITWASRLRINSWSGTGLIMTSVIATCRTLEFCEKSW